jgi:HEAT repeat protein
MQHRALPARVMPLLRAESPEVRRQASYTLAACGGEYVTAVLGTIVLHAEHPGYLQAIEGLRLLYGVLRAPTRTNVVRWLIQVLHQARDEVVLVTALDSLVYLLWQTQTRGQKQICLTMSQELAQDDIILRQFYSSSAWVRQRAIELAGMLSQQTILFTHPYLLHLLHTDSDSGVRACIAYNLGKMGKYQAIPDLLQVLLDPDEHVAQTALNALSVLTTPENPLFLYVLHELTHLDATHPGKQRLVRSAQTLLKRWHHTKKLHPPA